MWLKKKRKEKPAVVDKEREERDSNIIYKMQSGKKYHNCLQKVQKSVTKAFTNDTIKNKIAIPWAESQKSSAENDTENAEW